MRTTDPARPGPRPGRRRRTAALAGCALGSGTDARPGDGVEGRSWSPPTTPGTCRKKVMRQFTEETGYTVKVQPSGDAGALTNKLVLTKDSPIADVVYGIDNTFASRAVDEGVLADYTPETNPGEAFEPQDTDAADAADPGRLQRRLRQHRRRLVRRARRAAAHVVRGPRLDPRYRGLFVTPGAEHLLTRAWPSSLATVAEYGEDGWADYWQRLVDNDVKVTSGWSDAYQVDFTAGGGSGDRPIVLSYASSPPFTIPEGGDEPTTSALLDTCFRQVEYAAVLDGRRQPRGRPGVRRLHGGPRVPGGAARQHVRLPGRPGGGAAGPVGRVRRTGAATRRRCRRPTSPRTAPTGCRPGRTSPGDHATAGRGWRSSRSRRSPWPRSWSSSCCRWPAWWPAGCGSTAPFDPLGALEVLTRSRVHGVLWFTLWSAGAATLVTLLLGLPATFVLYRLRLPGRRFLRALVVMPFVMPTVVVGVAFRTLLAPSGPLGALRPRRHPGRPSSRPWCSSTSPSWCARSGRCGSTSTRAASRPRPRWAPRPGRCCAPSRCPPSRRP